MKIRSMTVGPVETNVYFPVNEETGETVIIDPGDEAERILDFLKKEGWKPAGILLTHGHFDHIAAVPELRKALDLKVYAGKREERLLGDGELNESLTFLRRSITVKPDRLLSDGEEFELAGLSFRMIDTPGHTEGSCCYYMEKEKVLFSGDTLFEGSVGRTDFATGSMQVLLQSLEEKLAPLPDEVQVFPGHGGATTIGDEKKWNPYWRKV